ncbi:ankyrin repeat-containing domain protein [Obelidium mucronatum]|nr:ankyrin repeat-containing domain protein [Obelidium mucronatum]
MHSAGLFDQEWAGLPLNYQTTLYGELLSADMPEDPKWVSEDDESKSDELFKPQRWNLNPTRALEIMQSLLQQNGNHNSSFSPWCQSNRPIHWAVINCHIEVVKLLLMDSEMDFSEDDDNLLADSVCFGGVEIVKVLLNDPRIDPASNFNAALLEACYKENLEIVKLLLAASPSVDPSMNDNLPILIASSWGYSELVKLLLSDPRVDPTVNDHKALFGAITEGHDEVVRLLLQDPRVDPTADGHRAFRYAILKGEWPVLEVFLEDSRVDPSVGRNVATISAATEAWPNIVEMLLSDPRVDPSAKENKALRGAMEGIKESKDECGLYWEVIALLLNDARTNFENDWDLQSELVELTLKEDCLELIELLAKKIQSWDLSQFSP